MNRHEALLLSNRASEEKWPIVGFVLAEEDFHSLRENFLPVLYMPIDPKTSTQDGFRAYGFIWTKEKKDV